MGGDPWVIHGDYLNLRVGSRMQCMSFLLLSGDGRLSELLRQEQLVPLASRIRTRLVTETAPREELLELLRHALAKAGNAALMTVELMETLVDHSAGNYRSLMIMSAELLATA